MLIVGKEASTLSTLHRIANCVKNGTRKIVSSNWYQHLVCCSVTHTYYWSSLRILFTVFLETKIQLWKLMWAISGCCIDSRGSPLHLPLIAIVVFSLLFLLVVIFRQTGKSYFLMNYMRLFFLFAWLIFCGMNNQNLSGSHEQMSNKSLKTNLLFLYSVNCYSWQAQPQYMVKNVFTCDKRGGRHCIAGNGDRDIT